MNKHLLQEGIQVLESSINPSYVIGKSKTHGKGVFASTNIRPNTNLGLAFTKIKNTNDPDEDYTRTPLGQYVNHSNIPNIKLMNKGNNYYYVAIKPIKRNDELFLDYSTFPWEGKRDFV